MLSIAGYALSGTAYEDAAVMVLRGTRCADGLPLTSFPVWFLQSWADRPQAATEIGNLLLASDYVRTHTELATMEGANEAGHRAVNAILLADVRALAAGTAADD